MKCAAVRFGWTCLLIGCLGLASCVTRPSAPTQFFMLTARPSKAAGTVPVPDAPTVRVALDPVEIPEYLNRPQIVTRREGVEYELDEFNRWLEPLEENITRVMAENLSQLLALDGVDIVSMARPLDTDYSIFVQILRLDGKLGEQMLLVARWSLFDLNNNDMTVNGRSVFNEAVEDASYQRWVQVQSDLIEALSREIADAIRPVVLGTTDS